MHRRRSLGFCLLLLLMFLAGPASAEPQAAPEAKRAVESVDLLDRVWEWLTSLVGGHQSAIDFGPFTDPNGNS
jgi:hypothetical protein